MSEGSVVKIASDVVISGCYVVKVDVQFVKIPLDVVIVKSWKSIKCKKVIDTKKY